MIFASQDPESKAFVVFLTVIIAIINIGMLVWLVVQMVREYAHEQKENAAKNGGKGSSLVKKMSNARESIQRWRFNRMTPEAQQRAIRKRTIDAANGNTAENPVTIEMTDINGGESTGEIKVDDHDLESIDARKQDGKGMGRAQQYLLMGKKGRIKKTPPNNDNNAKSLEKVEEVEEKSSNEQDTKTKANKLMKNKNIYNKTNKRKTRRSSLLALKSPSEHNKMIELVVSSETKTKEPKMTTVDIVESLETNPMLMSLQNKRIITNNDEKSLPKKSKWNELRSMAVRKKLLPRPPTLPSRNIAKPPSPPLKKKLFEQHFGKGKIKSNPLLNVPRGKNMPTWDGEKKGRGERQGEQKRSGSRAPPPAPAAALQRISSKTKMFEHSLPSREVGSRKRSGSKAPPPPPATVLQSIAKH